MPREPIEAAIQELQTPALWLVAGMGLGAGEASNLGGECVFTDDANLGLVDRVETLDATVERMAAPP